MTACGCGCGAAVKGRRTVYASDRCKWRAVGRRHRAARDARVAALRAAVLDRECRWCEATDAETPWSTRFDQCDACRLARQRSKCATCGGPKATGHNANHCPRCDAPPSWLAAVVVVDESSDRERTIYRAADGRRVSVASRFYLLPRDGSPLVLTLPTPVWVRTRD